MQRFTAMQEKVAFMWFVQFQKPATDFVYLKNTRSIFAQHLHLFSSSTAVRELQRQGWLLPRTFWVSPYKIETVMFLE